MRLGDCCRLLWSAVDLEGGFVTVRTSKSKGTATIPLFPLLGDEVRAALSRRRNEYVFPDCAMMYEVNPDGIQHRVEKVLVDAGFSDLEGAVSADHRGELRAKRKEGVRRACVRGFHSFRVTWVTLALNAGVPIELVRRVTSHKTVEVVLAHYYKPGRDDFRRALAEKMPKMFSLSENDTICCISDELLTTAYSELQAMTPENWSSIRDGLLQRLKVSSG